MAFDAGMLACSLAELRRVALGARIEKVYQPEKDEIVLQMRSFEGGKRLLINAGSNNPRINFSEIQKENPQNPPMFCVLLRKYLQGAKLNEITQEEFDRIAYLGFDTRDEMGFECRRYLIVELMGKYSNLIFANENKKIISALRTSDFSFDSGFARSCRRRLNIRNINFALFEFCSDEASDLAVSNVALEYKIDKTNRGIY